MKALRFNGDVVVTGADSMEYLKKLNMSDEEIC